MRSIILSAALLVGGVTGCMATTIPTYNDLDHGNFGDPPVDYQETIKEHLKYRLFDPFSAQYEFGHPEKAVFYTGGFLGVPAWGGERRSGWRVVVRFNAKNRYGGYVGWSAEYHVFDNQGHHWGPVQ